MKKLITVSAVFLSLLITQSYNCTLSKSEYLQLAEQTGTWLSSASIEEGNGIYWPPQPDTTRSGSITLYHGSPGPILFFLELYKASGDENALEQAARGTEWLISQAHDSQGGYYWSSFSYQGKPFPDAGLYTGTAGVGTVFLEMYKELKDEKYLKYARGAADYLKSAAVKQGEGMRWSQVTDIISGTAGTGMFMIKAAKELNDSGYLEPARQAGLFLIDQAYREDTGTKWAIYKGYTDRIYPNFSHGTSGISYYLALLYKETGEQQFLDMALEGAEWLINNRENPGEGAAWYHHEPDGKDLYYVSYCHGPPGTARLFYQLYLATGDEKWMDMVKESAKWLMSVGLLEHEIDGYWNVSQCCGTAGIGDFFVNMYKITGEADYFEWAQTMIGELKKQATGADGGLKWFNAENRTRPDEKYTQTGWAQGASGIGLFFLKMYAVENEKQSYNVLALPDCPFEWK
ncbi:lanthionine synthetase LanC family protein [candidate division KSB1 bacterium]